MEVLEVQSLWLEGLYLLGEASKIISDIDSGRLLSLQGFQYYPGSTCLPTSDTRSTVVSLCDLACDSLGYGSHFRDPVLLCVQDSPTPVASTFLPPPSPSSHPLIVLTAPGLNKAYVRDRRSVVFALAPPHPRIPHPPAFALPSPSPLRRPATR